MMAATAILSGLMATLPCDSVRFQRGVLRVSATATGPPRCNECSRLLLCRCRGRLWRRVVAAIEVAPQHHGDVIANGALDAVAGAIDDAVAHPHGRRAAAVEIHCRADA